ncbi:hypothetical protein QE418_000630 [Microbacterium testaceum]|uniref:hypothetical protein n=1 Tax=Microbacterium TaxID=33882 RepID=UPI0027894256|nr:MULTISPECIES: hypothetical protein [Microbacterium]MDQ1111182.1 hypothetical protein [Microbacterium testaceum]MDR6098278.1 hypothetical protein [Microbacterium sp. SORGH_AS_0454]
MTRYRNGEAPLSDLVYLGPEFYLPAGTAARWRELQRLAWEKYSVWLVPTSGWNGYRPLSVQYEYREELGIWAAVPGYSSHGLTFNGRDCAAIDVNNWASLAPRDEALAWARFVALCRIVGFTVDFVTPREKWHIGDFDPFTVPAFADITINPRPVPKEWEDMASKDEIKEAFVEALRTTDRENADKSITVSVPADDGSGNQVYWAVNLDANTKARLWNDDQLTFRRNLGLREALNQAPQVLDGMIEITVVPAVG